MISFVKMDACGNDYIYVDCRKQDPEIKKLLQNPAIWAEKWSDRHHGIGADGLVLICPSKVADARMRMFNADGSEGAMCGNAIRCVGMLIHETLRQRQLRIETKSGIRFLYIDDGHILVDMGPAILDPAIAINQKVQYGDTEYEITGISMGNPHCVIFTEDVETVDIQRVGPLIEKDTERFPDRTNVEFVQVVDNQTLKMRVWERGSGETLACGTGACAAVAAAIAQGRCIKERKVKVQLRGGELVVCSTQSTIFLQGPTAKIYEGWISL